MNHQPISPDDPRLTSYALNEMVADERAAFENELAHDPAARQAVEQIRLTGAMLGAALEHEAAAPEELSPPAEKPRAPLAKVIRFPFWMVSSLAAACFAVAFIYWQHDRLALPLVDSSAAPIGVAVASKDEAKSLETDRKEMIAKGNLVVATGARTAAAPTPQPAPVAMAAPAPAQDTASMNRLRAEKFRAVNETAKAERGAVEMERAAQALSAPAKKVESANQPLVDAGQLTTESYASHQDNGFTAVSQHPRSTLSVTVDTSSYANVRRMLLQGRRPPADAVRIEEMVNYFPYRYTGPAAADPIAANLEVASAPWAPTHRLVRIGLRGQDKKQADSTLPLNAKAVKIQVEFNPLEVQAYRLLGYENRLLAEEDFNNDHVGTGDMGAGHTVTALYELVPTGVEPPATGGVDALKYQRPASHQESRSSLLAGRDLSGPTARQTEILTVEIRYQDTAGGVSRKLEFPLSDSGQDFAAASQDFKFAAAVAAFGMVLRESPQRGTSTLDWVETWARAGMGDDSGGHRHEFLDLVARARALVP